MGKYEDAINAVRAFFGELPADAKKKCSLCNETLTHIVKLAEVETGAGTATVTRVLAEEINEGAADGDKVSAKALDSKVRYHEGRKSRHFADNSQNPIGPPVPVVTSCDKPEEIAVAVAEKVEAGMSANAAAKEVARETGKKPDAVRQAYNRKKGDPSRASQAANIVGFALAQLERLSKEDPGWEDAIVKLETWVEKFRRSK